MIKEFFTYTSTIKTVNPVFRFRSWFVVIAVYFLFLTSITSGKDPMGISIGVTFLLVFVSLFVGSQIHSMNQTYNLSSMYPLNYRRRTTYHLIYVVMTTILGFLVFIAILFIIYLIARISGSAVDAGENIEELKLIDLTFYYIKCFFLSFSAMILYLSSLQDNKQKGFNFLIIVAIHFVINTLVLSLLSGQFTIIGNINELAQNNQNLAYVARSGAILLLILMSVLIILLYRVNKPRPQQSR